MNARRIALVALVAPAVLLVAAPSASAHPLGNLSVNTYDGLVVSLDSVRVDHVEDIAEVPTVAALQAADTDRLDGVSSAELSTWARQRCDAAATRLGVQVDGRPSPLSVTSSGATINPGQAGLSTLRVECDLRATATVTGPTDISLAVTPPTDLGWREVTLAGDGVSVGSSDVPAASTSGRLTTYPGDLAASPDAVSARAAVVPGGPRLAATPPTGPLGVVTRGVDGITSAVEELATQTGPVALMLLVLGGLLLGALHALAPGHGKTIVAMAALAGRGARRRELTRAAITLGASVTVAHTGSVILVGIALTALGVVVPAAFFPALAILGGGVVVWVGVGLLRGRTGGHVHGPGGHTHGDDHDQHDQHDQHDHDHSGPEGRDRSPVALTASALATATAVARPAHDHDHDHDHDHNHDHGHVHAPARSGRRTLVALGAVGGLTPSPTALILLLGTLAVGRAWVGLLVVVAFGIGMAVTLVGAGLLAVVLGERVVRVAEARGLPTTWVAALPRLAGIAVVFAGLFLALRGVVDLLV